MKKLSSFTAIIIAIIFAIASCTKEQTGSSGATIKAVTGEVTEITSNSVKISGQAILGDKIPADTKFGVLCSISSEVLYGSAIEINATEFSADHKYNLLISGLIPGTTYYYRSFIYQNDVVTYGEVKSFATLPAPACETVDLGLSVKWASCNVGASSPEEYGRYFAWGDVTGQTWNGSSWSGGGFSTYPTYELDENKNLKPEYDAAHIIWGGSWRLPTHAEQQELIDNCTSTWTSDYNGTGVAGRIFISKKTGYTDKSIFLPAAGDGLGDDLRSAGSIGYYWPSTFYNDKDPWHLYFYWGDVRTYYCYRHAGHSVRPVTE